MRTFADWESPLPGDMEADLVSHGGESAAGSFVHTLTLTDVASGWTECVALVVRDGALVVAALEQMRTSMPFPLRGFDTDNGGEFMNETVAAYCREHGIPCTRSRPYHKNDQAWVEQKNGSVVRRLVGYRRLEGLAAAEALSRLYAASRLFVNFFQPSFKLASKARVGAKVRKTYHAPETPYAKLLASAAITDEMKTRLQAVAMQLDPLRLLEEIRAVQHHLAALAAGQPAHLAPRHAGSLDGFLTGLATAWQQGEVRATHRLTPRPARDWRTRPDPFEATWPRVRAWLEAEPDSIGKDALRPPPGRTPRRLPRWPAAHVSAPSQGMAARRRASAGLRVVTGRRVAVYSHKRPRRRHRRGTDEPPPSLSCGRHFARTGRRVQNNDRVGGARNHDRRPGKGTASPDQVRITLA